MQMEAGSVNKQGLFSSASTDAGRPPQELANDLHDAQARAVLGDWYEERGVDARNDLERVARISEILLRLHEIGRPDNEGRGRDEVLTLRREKRNLEEECSAIQRRLRDELAAVRGWAIAQSHFGFAELATGKRPRRIRNVPWSALDVSGLLDHAERFRDPVRPFRPAALLTHSDRTDDRAPFEELAAAAGLAVEFLPWSWYYPSRCVAALFTRPSTWKQVPSREELYRAGS